MKFFFFFFFFFNVPLVIFSHFPSRLHLTTNAIIFSGSGGSLACALHVADIDWVKDRRKPQRLLGSA